VRDEILLQFGKGERVFGNFSSKLLSEVSKKWNLQIVESRCSRVRNTVTCREKLVEERSHLLLGSEGAWNRAVDKPILEQGVRYGKVINSSANEQNPLLSRETAEAIQYTVRRDQGLGLNIADVARVRHPPESRRRAALT
jgi:hypothetical protein